MVKTKTLYLENTTGDVVLAVINLKKGIECDVCIFNFQTIFVTPNLFYYAQC